MQPYLTFVNLTWKGQIFTCDAFFKPVIAPCIVGAELLNRQYIPKNWQYLIHIINNTYSRFIETSSHNIRTASI